MPLPAEIRDLYFAPAAMTALPQALDLPRGVAAAFAQVQGVMLHQHWAGAYGEKLTSERIAETHLRPGAAILDHLAASAPADLRAAPARPPHRRRLPPFHRAGHRPAAPPGPTGARPLRLRHLLRRHAGGPLGGGILGRSGGLWRLGDAQLDAVQTGALNPDFDPLDVPPDRFLVAGEAWRRCRAGEADPATFGIMDMHGLWFVAGNLVRDLAALNNMEMLPWDVWGLMWGPGDTPTPETLAKLDRVAALTVSPDAHFADLRALYAADPDLRTPDQVFNALTQRLEPLSAAA